MKKIIAAIFVIAFLFANIGIQGAIYYSPTGWTSSTGASSGPGRHSGHTVTYGPGGEVISVSISCDNDPAWTCWSINGNDLFVDPIQTGPGGRVDMISSN
ncbi:MAG: hypothetical protein KGZ71_00265 [Desulfobulbaceae bacterium]|nr:hypothetical protein [Desulfobulbaceae bacterium]